MRPPEQSGQRKSEALLVCLTFRTGRGFMASLHHHVIEQVVFAPATQPAYSPSVDLLAQGGRLTKAQKLRLNLHGLSAPLTSMPLSGETVNRLKSAITPPGQPVRDLVPIDPLLFAKGGGFCPLNVHFADRSHR
jgi:hypothetical protein